MKNKFKNTLLIILGTLILSIAIEFFIFPADLNTGGISGIVTCFGYAGLTENFLQEIIYNAINASFFLLGLIVLGWKFASKTLLSMICSLIFVFLLKLLVNNVDWLLITNSPLLENQEGLAKLLCSIFGGACVGIGISLTFLGGGSTGGVDIITFVLCKYFKKIKSSVSIFAIDALIIIAGVIINPEHDLALALLGCLSAFIAALMVDKLFIGGNKTFVAYIVTEKPNEITQEVISILDRTTSILDIEGGYSKQSKKMVMVSFTMQQYSQVIGIVSRNDKDAFLTIHQAHEINGEGFKPLDK